MFDPVSIGIQIALAVGLSFLSKSMEKKEKPEDKSIQVTLKDPSGPRRRVYGQLKLGGNIVIPLSNNTSVAQAIYHCDGPIDSFLGRYLDDKFSESAASLTANNGLWPWGSNISFSSHLGYGDQTTDATLLANFAIDPDSHLKGCAYTVMTARSVRERDFQKVYAGGDIPELTVELRGALVYDPRDVAQDADEPWDQPVTWTWSDNAALCILDFLRHPDGFGISLAKIDLDSFGAFATVCDQDVALAVGGTEKRYRIWGKYEFNETRRDVLTRMLDACDGEVYFNRDGEVAIRGGVWEAPEVSLTGETMHGYEAEQGNDRLSAYNLLRFRFLDPVTYEVIEGTPWENLVDQALVGEMSEEISFTMVPSHTQARRLAKIRMAKDNPSWRIPAQTTMAGLLARRQRHITLEVEDIPEGTFRIEDHTVSANMTGCTFLATSMESTAYAWTTAEEGTAPNSTTPVTGGPSTETAALLVRMTTAPDAARMVSIDNLIVALKAAGVWTKLDGLYVLAAHDEQAALLNWKQALFNATKVGAATFTADRGFDFAAAQYLDTGFTPGSSTPRVMAQNDAHLSAYVRENLASNAQDMGTSAGLNWIGLASRDAADNARVWLNSDNTQVTFAGVTDGRGFSFAQRDASNIYFSRNGAAPSSSAKASTGLTITRTMLIGAMNASTPSVGLRAMGMVSFGQGGLSNANIAAFNTAVQAYMTDVGANV